MAGCVGSSAHLPERLGPTLDPEYRGLAGALPSPALFSLPGRWGGSPAPA